MTHIQKEPCLFCMAKWGRGWRVATETLGFGQTSPHFSTYSLLCIALHSLHRWFGRVFAKCMVVRCSLFEDTSPFQLSIAAMTGRGLLSTAARPAGEKADWFGTVALHLRMLLSVWSLWISSAPTHAVILTQGKKGEREQHVFSICITVWKRQEYWRPCKCNYSLAPALASVCVHAHTSRIS